MTLGHGYLASSMRMIGEMVPTAVHDEAQRVTLVVGMKGDMFAAPEPGICA